MITEYIIDPRYGHGHYGRLPASLARFLAKVGSRVGLCLETVSAGDLACGDCGRTYGSFGVLRRCEAYRAPALGPVSAGRFQSSDQ